jgi:mRNA interferase RelE/StbE
MAQVELTDDAKEDLRDLDGAAQKAVLKGLRKLQADPYGHGEPLGRRNSGDLTGFRKLVVGRNTYRVLYLIHETAEQEAPTIVVVWIISERADDRVYQLALSRLETMRHRELADELEQLLVGVFRG